MHRVSLEPALLTSVPIDEIRKVFTNFCARWSITLISGRMLLQYLSSSTQSAHMPAQPISAPQQCHLMNA
jgi:hypothetical protein